jgi:hypothetical protein
MCILPVADPDDRRENHPVPTTHSPDELTQMLVAGAQATGRTNVQAAIHLLTFTSLPHRHAFPELLDVEDVDGRDGPALAAFVKDWKSLPDSPAADRLGGGDQRLLALAVSLAAGEPVDLSANLSVGGYAHARRVIEAMAIATGYSEHYEIRPTAKLDQMIADRDALLNS